ncbi:hypothetical protein [Leptospira kanakyensis]|nr:hypothetical protein [Leptospira kanakyensis]MCW7469951.1 hypothetical protein [Leptospira kanakyensis]
MVNPTQFDMGGDVYHPIPQTPPIRLAHKSPASHLEPMDLNTINLKRFHLHYFSYLFLIFILSLPLTAGLVEDGYRLIFYFGGAMSFAIQMAILQLRFLPRKIPALSESGFPFFTVFLSFFLNLGILTALQVLEYPFEATSGFLIAYFVHLLFLVFASYFSGK